jgi:peptidoglycan/xylan/chitin deacetylase (PgdA/CDA1 family)
MSHDPEHGGAHEPARGRQRIPPVPILMYHGIGRAPRHAKMRSLFVTPARFARQMRLLHAVGVRGISMSEAMPYLRGERTGRIAVLTFDDGYTDNLEVALPILQRLGFHATCYVTSGLMGRYNVWDADQLNVRKPIMNPEQVLAWEAAGMEVGAHTRRHPRLTRCSDGELEDEIHGSKHDLETLLGTEVTQFCYPFGDHTEREAEAVERAGFAAATTTRRGRAHPERDDLFRLPRIFIGGPNLLHLFALKTLTPYEDRRG